MSTPAGVPADPDPDLDAPADRDLDLDVLATIQQRVLWLAVRMVDHANQRDAGGIKVGGHQASSTSMVTIATALWFAHLDAADRVAVKPHASPVFHAIQRLLGRLDGDALRTLRAFGGLQAYPSRTKDPDGVDISTGSVGLGAVAPLFAAAARRYVDHHLGVRPPSRFVALLGDAELDEGNVWEAITDPALAGLGSVLWVVDLNRQSLDRVVPGIAAGRLQHAFADAGWHVVEAKYGRRLQAAFAREGGEALRRHIDDMPNERYQSLFALTGPNLRERFLDGADAAVVRTIADIDDDTLRPLVTDLGGHDLAEVLRCYRAADAEVDRPSVVVAYTIKGWGLPIAGDPRNHSALLTAEQIDALRAQVGRTPDTEWDGFASDTPEGAWCRRTAARLDRGTAASAAPEAPISVPPATGVATARPTSTQDAFGRVLVALSRQPEVRERLVTASPDVSVSTNLGGWINQVGVFDREDHPEDSTDGLLRWVRSPAGQHIELGISEMNLFSLLEALGLTADHSDARLLPVGTLYDPFICRGLDALIHATYSGSRFVVVGTPSGVTLAPEGGAHQSTITASIGVELPGLVLAEPAYAGALDWLLCDGLARIGDPEGPAESLYLRLSTRPIDQAPFTAARDRLGDTELRRQVLAGGYRLVEGHGDGPPVVLASSGAVLPEVVAAQAVLQAEGVRATVIDVTSLTRLYRGWRATCSSAVGAAREPATCHLDVLLDGPERHAPIVTVHDAASHAMAWLGSVFGSPTVPVGVDRFGESGTIADLYDAHQLSSGYIVTAALAALARA